MPTARYCDECGTISYIVYVNAENAQCIRPGCANHDDHWPPRC